MIFDWGYFEKWKNRSQIGWGEILKNNCFMTSTPKFVLLYKSTIVLITLSII